MSDIPREPAPGALSRASGAAIALALAAGATAADGAPAIPLWPAGRMPGTATSEPEQLQPDKGDGVDRITNVSLPTLTVFRAAQRDTPAPAVVVCPGGGYGILAFNKEGTEVAAWLNTLGITAVVLKYRVPGNRDGAFQDIQRAVRVVRSHATDWGIDPARVGVLGFSAGGHLCARLSTDAAHVAYAALDAVDALPSRPDFAILVYPAYLQHEGKVSPELPVSAQTPPTLIVHTEDDTGFVPGSKIYHAALDAAGVPNAFELFATGGHGYGLRCTKDAKVWPERTAAWLAANGLR